eukprot:XP_002525546.2 uncharacterized protein LOC8277198 isoform X1 [Ricinus communis]
MKNTAMNEITLSSKLSKKSIFLFTVIGFGVYICYLCLQQISFPLISKEVSIKDIMKSSCYIHDIPPQEIHYVHFPYPKTYSREECACTPVRFFVIMSMQRSGSGWFETLLNSHPNVSSNGEIFSVKQRRSSISTIQATLDTVFGLEWVSSAAKNDCIAAVGFKWMLNQGVMVYHREIMDYFNQKGVSVIFLFRKNLLRRLVSVLANAYDRDAKQINGTHKSHVHTREEANLLAKFKPVLNISALISDLSSAEHTMTETLEFFKSCRHLVLYYEDLMKNPKALSEAQEFLRVPIRNLVSHQVKIHVKLLSEQIYNWEEVYRTLEGSEYKYFLNYADYIL